LNRYLNFREALYLPSQLDRIGAESRRDEKEFGFAQLRLVACFLAWSNVKEDPPEQFDSPLILVPVRLIKKKGIRDSYELQILDERAEVNPVLRYQMKQLFDLELPETILPSRAELEKLHEHLCRVIRSSEPAITLERIQRPRIDLVHAKARHRLDQFRRRARLSGRGVRNFMDVDYSYAPENYQPLGIQLFRQFVRPPETQLRTIIEQRPRPRQHVTSPEESPVHQRERQLYRLHQRGENANPFHWQFDLCSVTLANFKYRKMSLVRDYDGLLEGELQNDAFDATFSLAARPVEPPPEQLPLDQRYHVVACDPTQAASIARAQGGESYIIQGPPGTGKSQTITNLIADYVARGKRVLFVCEKRAAIDVVYLRLKQQNLHPLCTLIHDSQADKKEFVHDLKQTYEDFLAAPDPAAQETEERRKQSLRSLKRELSPLTKFGDWMQASREEAGAPLHELLQRAIELSNRSVQLTMRQAERLPDYALWRQSRWRIEELRAALAEVHPDGVYARHPLRGLTPRLAQVERPIECIHKGLAEAERSLDRLQRLLGEFDLDDQGNLTIDQLRDVIRYARDVAHLARHNQLPLLNNESDLSARFRRSLDQVAQAQAALEHARKGTRNWRTKLAADDVRAALNRARQFEDTFFPFLRPSWWRLRGVLRRSYDFAAHAVRPTWSAVLEALDEELRCRSAADEALRALQADFRFDGEVADFCHQLKSLQQQSRQFPRHVRRLHERLIAAARSSDVVDAVLRAERELDALLEACETFLAEVTEQTPSQLRRELERIEAAGNQLPDFLLCLEHVGQLPPPIARSVRSFPLSLDQLEAAIIDRALDRAFRGERSLSRFDGTRRDRQAAKLESRVDRLLQVNAQVVCHRVCQRFRENVRISAVPNSQLDEQQKALKKLYQKGRRQLEHEFGKSMRYRAIRDLVAGDSGRVIRDLKPVWLMSPLSVSDTLPLSGDFFDVVIFDEASQITVEEAIPSIFRAPQAIVVGDQMQLPPTSFFSAKRGDEDDELWVQDNGELAQYELDADSFLTHAARKLSSTMLGWHYRSRSESLISFSNWAFYAGRLLTVPDENVGDRKRAELLVEKSEHAAVHAAELLARPVSFHYMQHGIYEKRRNRAEAEYIAHLVRALLQSPRRVSIAVVAFSEAQQDEIESALQRLGEQDPVFQEALEAELERENDGEFVGLLIKNLENIQGDERDVVILSVCYGHDAEGKMRMHFGPINVSGGEKRLNVAFSRARHHMALVSSIRSTAITNDYNDGPRCLKNYLRYAAAASLGDEDAVRRVLAELHLGGGDEQQQHDAKIDVVVDRLAAAMRSRGYVVDLAVGQSHFRCDLAIRMPDDDRYRLGVLVDTPAHYRQPDVLEREMMKPRLLRAFGWRIAHVLTKDWQADAEAVLERLSRELGDVDANTGEGNAG